MRDLAGEAEDRWINLSNRRNILLMLTCNIWIWSLKLLRAIFDRLGQSTSIVHIIVHSRLLNYFFSFLVLYNTQNNKYIWWFIVILLIFKQIMSVKLINNTVHCTAYTFSYFCFYIMQNRSFLLMLMSVLQFSSSLFRVVFLWTTLVITINFIIIGLKYVVVFHSL